MESRLPQPVADTIPQSSGLARLSRLPWRIGAFGALAVSEILIASTLFGFPQQLSDWSSPVLYAHRLALILILAAMAFPLIAWPRKDALATAWTTAVANDGLSRSVLVNLGVFAGLLAARASLANLDPNATALHWYWTYSLLVLGTGASLALVAAPLAFWWKLLRLAPLEIAMALVGACLVLLITEVSKGGWHALSVATLALSHGILGLYEANPFIDVGGQILGADEFRVQISAPCSGYEGIGLVVAFLAIYLWVFRARLRFPNALCLIPIGIGAIWLLNAVRLSLLVSIGAHVSPAVALEGFHSWSGWIAFLMVTAAIMAASRYSAYVWVTPLRRAPARDDSHAHQDVTYLAPFSAFMAASILASAFQPREQWLYALVVAGIGATLWWYRHDYARLVAPVSLLSIVGGLAVGAAWIATEPHQGLHSPLGTWLAEIPLALAGTWLVMRAVGAVVLVPIAEELAFRGYLCRALASSRSWLNLTPVQLRVLALIVSSLAFGILHERFLAATLSGVVYAALMYRTNRLSEPIAAHMASNAVIVLWAIAAQQWTLLD